MEKSQEFQRAKEDQATIRDNMERVSKDIAGAEF